MRTDESPHFDKEKHKPGKDSVEPVRSHFCLDEEKERLREADDPAVHHVVRRSVRCRLVPAELLVRRIFVVVFDVLQ